MIENQTDTSTKKYHHGDLCNALIECGADLVRSKGIAALSLREIAKQLGVSHTAPYRHFKDKNALMVAIAQKAYDELGEQLKEVAANPQLDPIEKILECGCQYVRYALENPEFSGLMFNGQYQPEKAYKFSYESNSCFQLITRLFIEAQEQNAIREEPAQIQALSLWTSVHGLIMLYVSGQIPTESENTDQILKLARIMQKSILSGAKA